MITVCQNCNNPRDGAFCNTCGCRLSSNPYVGQRISSLKEDLAFAKKKLRESKEKLVALTKRHAREMLDFKLNNDLEGDSVADIKEAIEHAKRNMITGSQKMNLEG